MSKNSKAKRDARKKKLGSDRHRAQATGRPFMAAHLLIDGETFAAMGFSGKEWNLIVQDQVAAGTDEPATIWAILQNLAARAEANGNTVSVQSAAQLKPLVDPQQQGANNDSLDDLVEKILSVYPLPQPSISVVADTH